MRRRRRRRRESGGCSEGPGGVPPGWRDCGGKVAGGKMAIIAAAPAAPQTFSRGCLVPISAEKTPLLVGPGGTSLRPCVKAPNGAVAGASRGFRVNCRGCWSGALRVGPSTGETMWRSAYGACSKQAIFYTSAWPPSPPACAAAGAAAPASAASTTARLAGAAGGLLVAWRCLLGARGRAGKAASCSTLCILGAQPLAGSWRSAAVRGASIKVGKLAGSQLQGRRNHGS